MEIDFSQYKLEHRYYWAGQKMWDGNFTVPVSRYYKISLCTNCMDRLHDLSQTLPFNIEHERYPQVEFVLLDYNSRKDDVGKWVQENMGKYIEKGVLNYYRTDEPQHYSMSHSRNMQFKLAQGDIVINVDGDNFIQPRDGTVPTTLCERINLLANQAQGQKAIFAKGKRLLHGRLGFFKKEFLELGGYDEEMIGYGYEDCDLMRRAWFSGFTLYWIGGLYIDRIRTPNKQKGENMPIKNWRETEVQNKLIGYAKLEAGQFIANVGVPFGKGKVVKNFKEEIEVI